MLEKKLVLKNLTDSSVCLHFFKIILSLFSGGVEIEFGYETFIL